MIQRVKGTQDFLDLRLYNFIIQATRTYLERANFTEIATPILEPTELFARAVGAGTDIVHKEMYQIKTHDEDESICLRPEATASIARAFVENGIQITPWKVFTHGPQFRYERPQKGRFRQFHQVSMEIIGSASMATDALFLKQLDTLFTSAFHLHEYALAINFLGTPDDRARFKDKLKTFLDAHVAEICQLCQTRKDANILRVFDCKNETCQKIYQDAPKLVDHLSEASEKEWQELQTLLKMLSVSFVVKPTLVRGLDYYNKTVFEFISPHLGAQSTFCGGGRYDHLVSIIGGKEDQPSIGAAFGIERMMLLLQPIQDRLALPQPKEFIAVIPFDSAQNAIALLTVDALQQQGLTADVIADEASLKSKLRKANKLTATYVVLIGPDEQAAGMGTVKQMITGAEQQVKLTEIAHKIKNHEIK